MKVLMVEKVNCADGKIYDCHIYKSWGGIRKYIVDSLTKDIEYLENTLFEGYILKPRIEKLYKWISQIRDCGDDFPFAPAGGSEMWFTAYPEIDYYYRIIREEVGE